MRFALPPISIALLFLAAHPSCAQTVSPKQDQAKPTTLAPPASQAFPPKTASALKLAGLVTFVANSCLGLKPNYDRFEAAIHQLGITTNDLAREDMKAAYLAYTSRYQTDTKDNCDRALTQFGPHGATLPGIFELHQ